METAPRGFVLYRGKSCISKQPIVAIAVLRSSNVKTGNMIQVYILPEDISPLAALKANDNSGSCGNCPLQGNFDDSLGKMVDRVCYVNVGQAPEMIWKTWKNGKYPRYLPKEHDHLILGRTVRWGAYGDPAALPLRLIRRISDLAKGWTGYSHQLLWIDRRRADVLAEYLMCSVDNPAQWAEAKRRNYRSFVVVQEGFQPSNAVQCPHYSHGVKCEDCRLCDGQATGAKDVYVIAHGKVGNNLKPWETS